MSRLAESGQHCVWFHDDICNQGLNTITKVQWPQELEGVEAQIDGWMAEEKRWKGDKLLQQAAYVAAVDV